MLKLGILGGSFNPVHFGHLNVARQALDQLGLSQVSFLPCHHPPHRPNFDIRPADRIAMLELALANKEEFRLDLRELDRDDVSYSYTSLLELRAELGEFVPIVFIIGWDSWLSFTRWHRWQDIINMVNIAIKGRPNYSKALPEALLAFCRNRQVAAENMCDRSGGRFCYIDGPLDDISSSEIRLLLQQSQGSPAATVSNTLVESKLRQLMPDTVLEYIRQHKLYV